MNYSTTGKLFSGHPVSDLFHINYESINKKINTEKENSILNYSIEQYADHLESIYTIAFPVIFPENKSISSFEKEIPGNILPPEFSPYERNQTVKKNIIVFHIPYSGDLSYLEYRPDIINLSGIPSVTLGENDLQFEYLNLHNISAFIENQFNTDLRIFLKYYYYLKNNFDTYNSSLRDFIIKAVQKRKKEILHKNNFLASFNIPLKTNDNLPSTFSIPSPRLREKIIIQKPPTSNTTFTPEPVLLYSDYQKILKIINDAGLNIERHPSLYIDKQEENLRDFFLFALDPHFVLGSASGETFNKKGKTDILLRYDSSVVFIAECKFWTGQKGFHKTIDQLLSYLTWRDSKTAIIIFVPKKEISSVLFTIEQSAPVHPSFIKLNDKKAENWWEYIFHLPADQNKELTLSILIYHFPPMK